MDSMLFTRLTDMAGTPKKGTITANIGYRIQHFLQVLALGDISGRDKVVKAAGWTLYLLLRLINYRDITPVQLADAFEKVTEEMREGEEAPP